MDTHRSAPTPAHAGGGIEASWALDHPERQENFGHRAVHLTAEAAKSILRHYYGETERYSYFVGCSRGGGQAMMESQRYPEDFDGIVAAAPAYHWTALTAGFVQTQQAIYPDGDTSTPVITPENLALLGSSILAACDAHDGVEDGTMTDPRSCDFEPADLPRCADDAPGVGCVTAEQVAAIEAVYDGPTANGEPLFFGFTYGGENDRGGWDSWSSALNRRSVRGYRTRTMASAPSSINTSSSAIPTGTTPNTTSRHGRPIRPRRPTSSMRPIPTSARSGIAAERSSTGPAGPTWR